MASARNIVLSGDYENYSIKYTLSNTLKLFKDTEELFLTKENVESYEILDQEKLKSGTSAVLRGLGGAMLLGPVGLLAGLSAKNKEIILVALLFKDGKKSLLEIDGKIYRRLVTILF